ncbi:PREDICTED: protein pinocchio isoform X2 [Rhagoletis zephyria]|nr:PREDICTED: protein pinocchio isoform X2 [Rhagoletis zephyria]XP_017481485.1 PREDICTED: protein pinocchio isoform X2 [Rhagoletis zephyria]
MKNRPISNGAMVTEWEDNVLFDADDPDFCGMSSNVANVFNTTATANIMAQPPILVSATGANDSLNALNVKVPTTMSLASVHGPQFTAIYSPLGRSSISMSSSLSDLVDSPLEISVDNVLTIEELRQHMGSCFTCGVSWTDDHVSLDCTECGGYSLERPCPLCDGQCGVQWKRDFTMSHACGKARWHGVCPSYHEAMTHLNPLEAAAAANATSSAAPSTCASAATHLRLAQELCLRLEQLSAGAHT